MANILKSRFLTEVGELASRLGEPNLRVVDCRFSLLQPQAGHDDYLLGHIPGAVYADLDKDLAAPVTGCSGRHPLPQVAAIKATLEAWGIAADTTIVAYDQQNGVMASRLWWMLRWLGHPAVTVLEGGYDAWKAARLPLEAGPAEQQKAEFVVRLREDMVVTTAEIVAGVEQGDLPLLVDARESERFSGRTEPIDSVAGHIPGAVNMPFAQSQGTDGQWLLQKQLRAVWQPILAPAVGGEWLSMCGSGVTACHLALSAQYAGFAAPRLYIGSWSEWIRDPQRPRESA